MMIAARHLLPLLEYGLLKGIPARDLYGVVNSDPERLGEESALLPEPDFYALIRKVNAELNDGLWGIRAAELLQLRLLGVIYRISLQVRSIGEALHYLQQYLAASLPVVTLETAREEEWIVIRLAVPGGPEGEKDVLLEHLLTIIGRELNIMAGRDILLRLESPRYTEAYPKGWEHGPSFSVRFEARLLEAGLKDSQHYGPDLLVPDYLKLMESWKGTDTFTGQVKAVLLHLAAPELPGLETAARALNLTPRTLQRRLEAEGCSFRRITDELKQQIALLLLHHPRYAIRDISLVLGYAEPAAFIHSFQKWFGKSPGEQRAELGHLA